MASKTHTIDRMFESHCVAEGITSDQFQEDIRPHFVAGVQKGRSQTANKLIGAAHVKETLVKHLQGLVTDFANGKDLAQRMVRAQAYLTELQHLEAEAEAENEQ